jgi:hypothetical protein
MRSEAQLRVARSKQSERDLGHWLQENDAPDSKWRNIASSTGRVGHLTGLQFDVVSLHYAAENKQVKVPARLWKWWKQLLDVASTQGKDALLRIEPTNLDLGVPAKLRKHVSSLHIITEDRHKELLEAEKQRDFLEMRVAELEQP